MCNYKKEKEAILQVSDTLTEQFRQWTKLSPLEKLAQIALYGRHQDDIKKYLKKARRSNNFSFSAEYNVNGVLRGLDKDSLVVLYLSDSNRDDIGTLSAYMVDRMQRFRKWLDNETDQFSCYIHPAPVLHEQIGDGVEQIPVDRMDGMHIYIAGDGREHHRALVDRDSKCLIQKDFDPKVLDKFALETHEGSHNWYVLVRVNGVFADIIVTPDKHTDENGYSGLTMHYRKDELQNDEAVNKVREWFRDQLVA